MTVRPGRKLKFSFTICTSSFVKLGLVRSCLYCSESSFYFSQKKMSSLQDDKNTSWRDTNDKFDATDVRNQSVILVNREERLIRN